MLISLVIRLQLAVLLTVLLTQSYRGNDVTYSTLLERVAAVSKYRSYSVSKTAAEV